MFSFANKNHLYLHKEWVHLSGGSYIWPLCVYSNPERGCVGCFALTSQQVQGRCEVK